MPANLTPQYLEAEERFKKAETAEERLTALEEMLRQIPKHKGTEKMQADLKSRMAKLRKEAQKEKSSGRSRQPFHYVEREGIGRVVLCGPANSGKSNILSRLTHAHPEVADYPFTTRAPLPGMMQFEDVQIQLVDTPPLAPEILEPWQLAMIEQADVAALIFDVTDPMLLDQTEYVLAQFDSRGIPIQLDQKPRILVLGNKIDRPGGAESFSAWVELFIDSFSPKAFSANSMEDLEFLRQYLFQLLEVVRVYTKAPGAKPEKDPVPFVLPKGSTVFDVAAMVHKELAESLKYARIWGEGKYEGQMVERDYVVSDGDLLEIHG